MEKYRIGNDIKVKWVIFRNGKQPEDFTKATIQELRLNNVTSGDSLLPTYSVSGNVITVEYPASQQKKAGVFTLTLKYTKKLSPASTEDQYTIDKENAFEIVAQTRFEESDPEIPGVIESFVYRNRDGKDGATPDIGKNENWWLNGKDTGKPSRGRAFASSDFTEAEWNELKKPSLDAAGVATDAAIRCDDVIRTTNAVKESTIAVRDETSRVKSETNAVKLATEDVKNQTEASKGACDEATSQSITQTGNAQKATAETIKSSILATDAAGNFDKAIVQTYPTVEPTTKTTVINAQDTFKKFKEQEGKMAQLEQNVCDGYYSTTNYGAITSAGVYIRKEQGSKSRGGMLYVSTGDGGYIYQRLIEVSNTGVVQDNSRKYNGTEWTSWMSNITKAETMAVCTYSSGARLSIQDDGIITLKGSVYVWLDVNRRIMISSITTGLVIPKDGTYKIVCNVEGVISVISASVPTKENYLIAIVSYVGGFYSVISNIEIDATKYTPPIVSKENKLCLPVITNATKMLITDNSIVFSNNNYVYKNGSRIVLKSGEYPLSITDAVSKLVLNEDGTVSNLPARTSVDEIAKYTIAYIIRYGDNMPIKDITINNDNYTIKGANKSAHINGVSEVGNVKYFNHRGVFNDEIPENSIYSVMYAWLYGCKYVECDVVYTSDGVPVIMHDTTINRTMCNSDGSNIVGDIAVATSTLAQLQQYRYKSTNVKYRTKINTLYDYIDYCATYSICPILQGSPNMNDLRYVKSKIGDNFALYSSTSYMKLARSVSQKCLCLSSANYSSVNEMLADFYSIGGYCGLSKLFNSDLSDEYIRAAKENGYEVMASFAYDLQNVADAVERGASIVLIDNVGKQANKVIASSLNSWSGFTHNGAIIEGKLTLSEGQFVEFSQIGKGNYQPVIRYSGVGSISQTSHVKAINLTGKIYSIPSLALGDNFTFKITAGVGGMEIDDIIVKGDIIDI